MSAWKQWRIAFPLLGLSLLLFVPAVLVHGHCGPRTAQHIGQLPFLSAWSSPVGTHLRSSGPQWATWVSRR